MLALSTTCAFASTQLLRVCLHYLRVVSIVQLHNLVLNTTTYRLVVTRCLSYLPLCTYLKGKLKRSVCRCVVLFTIISGGDLGAWTSDEPGQNLIEARMKVYFFVCEKVELQNSWRRSSLRSLQCMQGSWDESADVEGWDMIIISIWFWCFVRDTLILKKYCKSQIIMI